jgi:fumarate reductase flavoprotein subunit
MSEERRYDVAIVGGGIAGLMTANRLAQLGTRAVVLEQGSEERYLCNTRYTGGTFHVCLRDIMLEEATLKDAIRNATAGFVSETWAEAIAREGRRAVRWLQDEGVRFMKVSAAEHHKWVLAPPGRNGPGLDWKGRSGDVLLRTLEANLAKRGGALVRNARVLSLLIEHGACRGVIAEHDGHEVRYRTRAVVIADGGFQANPELVGLYICERPQALQQRNAGTAQGDGLTMALAVGACLVGADRFYGHVLSRDAMTNDKLWPYPYLDSLATAGIVVDAKGDRFTDEGRGGVYIANAIAKLADPLSAFVIFDNAIWEGAGRAGLIPPNPHLPAVGGTVVTEADLETLARGLGMDPSHLKGTVRAYNASVAAREPVKLDPPRSTMRYPAQPVASPPFYAVPACSGITATMGGIAIDEHARALRDSGEAISGLYVAGGAAGGLEGGPEVGYVGGLVKCGVTALIAAEHIAAKEHVA